MEYQAQIVVFEDGEHLLEVLHPGVISWRERLRLAWRYLWNRAPIVLTVFPLSEAEMEELRCQIRS